MDDGVARALVVAKVLAADGMMAPEEKVFLGRVMGELGLDEAQRAKVHDLEGIEEADAAVAALPEADRRAIVDQVLEAALVDGKLSPHETEAVAKLTTALGLD
jgi:tellurite resistance protein